MSLKMRLSKVCPWRKQTIIFLDIAKNIRGVTLVGEVRIKKTDIKYATPILIKAISEVLSSWPHLNCMVKIGSDHRLICMDEISARLTLSYDEERGSSGVYSALLKNTDKLTIQEINNELVKIKSEKFKKQIYKKFKLIQKTPVFWGKLLAKSILYFSPNMQKELFGSFTVTSFGKNSQHLCIPLSGSTFTFTLGAPKKNLADSYLLNLVMVFDHRVLDGLEASIFLEKIKNNFSFYTAGTG